MILITAGFKAKLFTAKTIKAEPCFLYIPAGMSICDERKSRFTLCSPHNYDPCTLRARINTQKVTSFRGGERETVCCGRKGIVCDLLGGRICNAPVFTFSRDFYVQQRFI